jgi:2,3-bisphosphoglycerate-dependent phosphoglycerate mutase
MIVLHLVRHAQQDWDRETPDAEWPLTPLGREQAASLVEKLACLRPDSLWCSETLRAFQTIQPFAEHSGLRVNRHHDLGERRLTWPPPPMDEMKEHYRRGWEDLDYCLPDGESNREGQTRFMAALRFIVEREGATGSDRSVVVCAHGNVIALAEHAATGSFGSTSLGYCERRMLTLRPDGWHLLEGQPARSKYPPSAIKG